MNCRCPNCGTPLLLTVQAAPAVAIEAAAPEFLEPCRLADRLGLSEAYVRKLCSRGHKAGEAGIERSGGRWLATADTIDRLRRVSGAF